MKNLKLVCALLLTTLLVVACGQSNKAKMRTDTKTSGIARIVVDECLAPVIQQQVDVFESTYPNATIIPVYTSDKEAYKLFNEDSIRLIVGTRELTESEKQAATKDRKQSVRSKRLAVDGVALIVNKNNNDTLITVETIKKIMTGEIRSWKELNPESKLGDISIVFDSPNSSTARFISDSITKKAPFGNHVQAIGSDKDKSEHISQLTPNQQVINYVEGNKNALGIIGVNWICNPSDTTGLSFDSRINVMSINDDNRGEKGKYYKPYTAYLALNWYPLSRDVYIIITDVQGGLPAGFVNFAAGEKGQRIVNKSGLFPATVPTRIVRIHPTYDY